MADEKVQRLNYFLGQYLEEEDFQAEQQYHRDMRHRFHRALYNTAGILDGFQVEKEPADTETKTIRIGAGVGVDAEGREVVLLHRPLKPTLLTGFPANKAVDVFIQHNESKDNLQTAPDGLGGATRVTEEPKIEWVVAGDLTTIDRKKWINLAQVTTDASGKIAKIEFPERQYAGARFPGNVTVKSPDSNIYSLGFARTDESGREHRWALWHMNSQYRKNALEIWEYKTDSSGKSCDGNRADGAMCDPRLVILEGGNIGIGTTDPKAKLDVNGNIAIMAHSGTAYSGSLMIGGTDHTFSVLKAEPGTLTINEGRWANVVIPTGNVGIGAARPSVSLEVAGTVKAIKFEGDGASLTGILRMAVATIAFSNTDASGATREVSIGFRAKFVQARGVARVKPMRGGEYLSGAISGFGDLGPKILTSQSLRIEILRNGEVRQSTAMGHQHLVEADFFEDNDMYVYNMVIGVDINSVTATGITFAFSVSNGTSGPLNNGQPGDPFDSYDITFEVICFG